MTILSQKFVFDALEAEKNGVKFPIFFDDVWQALGFKQKHNARRSMYTLFAEGLDFQVLSAYDVVDNPESLSGFQRSILKRTDCIKLTIDTFKHLCFVPRTEIGRQNRRFFIEIETAYRQGINYEFTKILAKDNEMAALKLENMELKSMLENLKNELSVSNHKLRKIESQEIKDKTKFTRTIDDLLVVSGIAKYDHLYAACMDELIQEKDYTYRDGMLVMTRYAMAKMLMILRSDDGVLLERVPDVKLSLRDLVKSSSRKINRRSPQNRQ